jgi:voltage-gated potassium channel
VIVLAVRRADGQMVFNPDPDTVIQAGDFLIAMGNDQQLRDLNSLVEETAS